MAAVKNIGISWPASSYSGWGVYGLNLTLQIIKQNRNPVWISPPQNLILNHETEQLLTMTRQRQSHLAELYKKTGHLKFDFPVLHSLRNDFKPALDEQAAIGSKNIGVIFFENTKFSSKGLERANEYDLIITGSTWNRSILESKGLSHVKNVFQGVDTTLFSPEVKENLYPNRFTIFSGGKLEYRKAQDIVITAFREFYSNHDDALLICAWTNQWLPIMRTISNSSHVKGFPEFGLNGETDLSSWLEKNGLSNRSFIDMPKYLISSDTALFPNRCEPGTNLVAMEAMAAGIPVILSNNSGHLDLIDEYNCYPLLKQTTVKPFPPYAGVDGWGEPDVQEVLGHLESIYNDKLEASKRAKRGIESVSKFTWKNQIQLLLKHIDNLVE